MPGAPEGPPLMGHRESLTDGLDCLHPKDSTVGGCNRPLGLEFQPPFFLPAPLPIERLFVWTLTRFPGGVLMPAANRKKGASPRSFRGMSQ